MSLTWNLLLQTAPLFIAALGGLLSELSGRLNIGLEGAILFGAFVAAAVFRFSSDVLSPAAAMTAALAFAAGAGTAAGVLTAWLSIRRGANVFIVGLGVNLMAWGLIPLLSQFFIGSKGVINLSVDSAFRNAAALVGLIIAAALGIFAALYLSRHTSGLRLRKIYLDEYSARIQGTDVDRYRYLSLTLSSTLSALAGGIIALHLGSYVPNLSAGKGWIALVIIYLGNRRVLPMLGASLFFAVSQLAANEAQRFFAAPGILLGLPYFLTLIALIAYRGIQQSISSKRRR
jgi:ABC-type uncharacterized transport system permease subunit